MGDKTEKNLRGQEGATGQPDKESTEKKAGEKKPQDFGLT